MRRRIILILTFVAGTLPILSLFSPHKDVDFVSGRLDSWMVIVSGFALTLGVGNVLQTHTRRIARQEEGWGYSIALLIPLFIMGGLGIAGVFGIPAGGIGKNPDGSPTPFDWTFANVFFPLQATMFSLLAFFMASAAFRAFRVRSFQATLLLTAAVIVILGRIPFGETIFSWLPASTGARSWLPSLTNWIMDKPNSAAQSGIIIGAALGAAAMSLRVILGMETSFIGKGKDG